jgi:hypothetical protein
VKEPITSLALLENLREKKGVPTSVFKYFGTTENDFKSFSSKYLFFSKYKDFNDPFDCSINLLDFGYKKIHNTTKKEEFLNSLSKIGICCFSRNRNSILMWSHYAQKHQGYCIEFNTGITAEGINPLDVIYKKEFTKANFIIDGINSIYHIIYSKASEWFYEDELRAVLTGFKDLNSRCVKFNDVDVKAIYLGVNCALSTKHRILKIINDSYSNTVDVYESKISENLFEITFTKI